MAVDQRVEYRRQIIRGCRQAVLNSIDEAHRERALWQIEKCRADIQEILAAEPSTDEPS